MGRLSRVTAGCFALAAFAVATFAGLAGGNPASLVLGRALMAMLLCYPVGMIVGAVLQRLVTMQVQDAVAAAPVATGNESTQERISAAPKAERDATDEEVITV